MRSLIIVGALLVLGAASAEEADIVAELNLRPADAPVRDAEGWGPKGPIVVRVDSQERLAWLQQVAVNTTLIGVKNKAEALQAMPEATALIGMCSRELVKAAPDLHWIQLSSAGAESCIAETADINRDLLITNMQRATSPQIAEHVMGMLLSLTRGLVPHIRNQNSGKWTRGLVPMSERPELGGKTILLVGLGGIGTAVGQRAAAFGMRITAVRASTRPGPGFIAELGQPDQLLSFAARADVVVNSVPLTALTKGLFDAKFFAAMKPTAYFISVGRGKSVVTADLVTSLQTGEIAGAGLDVTDPEPLPTDHPLWQLPNVIITPHIAAGSDQTLERNFQVVRENLRRYVSGEPMLSVVNIERGY
jgi:phosphoglycerate dehydrogenase-like enzyme